MIKEKAMDAFSSVTPFAGVWIEILIRFRRCDDQESLPSRECGLKSFIKWFTPVFLPVTPFAGVWIEIMC